MAKRKKYIKRFLITLSTDSAEEAQNLQHFYASHITLLIHGLNAFRKTMNVSLAEIEDSDQKAN